MKITKEEVVVVNEVDVLPGVYYFECSDHFSHCLAVSSPGKWNDYEYRIETLKNFANLCSIMVREEEVYEGDDLPYHFKKFMLGLEGKEITEEEFKKERQEILERLR